MSTTTNGNGTQRFESLRAEKVFPGRVSVHPREVASVLSISIDQVEMLKDADHLEALPITIGSDRCHYRITVASYDQFILNGGTKLIEKNHVKARGAHVAKNGHAKNGHIKHRTSNIKHSR
jgi:hypothetical protein